MIHRMSLLLWMVFGFLNPILADDWPQWGGPTRNYISKETGLLESWPPNGPKLLWTFREAGVGYSSMAIVGDRLYSMGAEGDNEYLFALDLNTRKKLWSVEAGPRFNNTWGDGPCSTPTIDGNFIYAIGAAQGDLVCVHTATGKKVWSQSLKMYLGKGGRFPVSGYCQSPLVDGDQVVAISSGEKGNLLSFDKKTGTLKWSRTPNIPENPGNPGYSSVLVMEVAGIRQYVYSSNGDYTLSGVRATDGKLLWRDGPNLVSAICMPICHDGCIYTAVARTPDNSCRKIKLIRDGDQFKIELIYFNKEMSNYHGSVVLVGGYVYGCSHSTGRFVCQNFKTGKMVWSNKGESQFRGSVVYADGNLYFYNEGGGVALLIKATSAGYQVQGKFPIPEQSRVNHSGTYTHPVVANGRLFLRDQELIFCCDIRKLR